MKAIGLVLATIGAVCLTAAAHAGLEWETRALEFTPTIREKTVTGEFRFTNRGDTVISIIKIKSSCGCATATPDKKAYAPGESGQIAVTLELSGQGSMRKYILVNTDDADAPVTTLTITAHRPEFVTFSTRYLTWEVDDPLEPRSVEITIAGDAPGQITTITPNRKTFDIALETIEPGRRYRLVVTPRDTTQVVYCMITLETDLPADRVGKLPVFARVLRTRQ